MKKYDVIVIGFGKAGKTLAGKWASEGQEVALIEKDPNMYGGTCINIGCIPSKTLMVAAKKGLSFEEVISEKNIVTNLLRGKNFDKLNSSVDIYVGSAKFDSDKVIDVDGEKFTADRIVINTGAESRVPEIEGIDSNGVYDSTGIQNLDKKPSTLGIIGGGNIGLEFANIYNLLGTKVTIFNTSDAILKHTEPEVREMATSDILNQGIQIEFNASVTKLENRDSKVILTSNDEKFEFDAVLYATGRSPLVKELGLENTSIKLTERGAIQTNEFCETTVENIFAVGDVKGGLQFTYTSLDDFRIVYGYCKGNTSYSLKNQRNVPNTTFITPHLSMVGLTEAQAKEKGYNVKVNSLPVAAMPRGQVNRDLRGLFKVVVDADTKQILGSTLYGQNSEEIINLITLAMDNKIEYTYFQKQIFTHPTMAENLNDLFAF